MRSFDVKVNRKAKRAALRGAPRAMPATARLALVDASTFEAPSTKQAAQLLADWGQATPTLVVAAEDDGADQVVPKPRARARHRPLELEVAAVVGALVARDQAALPQVEGAAKPPVRAGGSAERAWETARFPRPVRSE